MPATLTNPQPDALAAAWQHAGAGFAETRAPKIPDKNLIRRESVLPTDANFAGLRRVIDEIQKESVADGSCNLTMDEINAVIAEVRSKRLLQGKK
ncbi:MAG: hypothetical protein LBP75_03870 [Planctomycetota bacterium]|nr:hypothetical protein [Planctomycetota bacterium]